MKHRQIYYYTKITVLVMQQCLFLMIMYVVLLYWKMKERIFTKEQYASMQMRPLTQYFHLSTSTTGKGGLSLYTYLLIMYHNQMEISY